MSKEMRKLIDDFKTFNNKKLNENSEKQYLVKVKPNDNNKQKWYYGRKDMTEKEFKVMNGVGDFEGTFVIQTKGGSGGTYHFDKDDVEILDIIG